MTEEWRPVNGYEGIYEVSSFGRVRSLPHDKPQVNRFGTISVKHYPGMVKKPKVNRQGYLRIGLSTDGRIKYFFVHRLVAAAFIPNPQNLPQINHKDEDKQNNRVGNLEWCTARHNINYGNRTAIAAAGRRKKVGKYDKDGNLLATYNSIDEAAAANGTLASSISRALHNPKSRTLYGCTYRILDR